MFFFFFSMILSSFFVLSFFFFFFFFFNDTATTEIYTLSLHDALPIAVMTPRLVRGDRLPGFGQLLYPEGDPRAIAIFAALAQAAPEAHTLAETAAEIGLRLTGRHPNVDFALAAAATGLGLPRNAALGLFIVGRTVGWIAHATEQYESGILIRPRARYLGPQPEERA